MKELKKFRQFLAEGQINESNPIEAVAKLSAYENIEEGSFWGRSNPSDVISIIIDMMVDEGILTSTNYKIAIPYIKKAMKTHWKEGNDEGDVARVAYKAMKEKGII